MSPVCNANVGALFAVKFSQHAFVIILAVAATNGSIDLGQTKGTAENIRIQWFAFALVCFTNVGPLLAVMDAQFAS